MCVCTLLPPPRRIRNRRCLSVCLLATLRKNFRTDLHEIFRENWQWITDLMDHGPGSGYGSGSGSRYGYKTRLGRGMHCPRASTPCLKNVPPFACYNFDIHEWILTFFGRNVTDKSSNQKTLHYATSNNLYFCTTWQNRKTRKFFTQLDCVTRAMHPCAVFLKEKNCRLWRVW